MTALTDPMHRHHKHCDSLFAEAEAAAAKGEWQAAAQNFNAFHQQLETHFRTEEEVLFPAFEATTGMTGGPTQMMRFEHAQMRDLVARMDDSMQARDAAGFAGAAETLLILMQQHNMKEENILYPMCDRSLASQSGPLGARLNERLDETCLTTP
ncbi:MAG: hemerythrin domain-containing protein [Rhodocyclaceae bacterium]|jgi:hemerythrin-like domain-containing protein|nr:hemerythrin domain-containing protein [Rhodocyclaceae bacterium]